MTNSNRKAGKKPAKKPEFLSICPEQYQRIEHYSDRSTIWIKLYVDLLRNFEFCRLPDETKWHFVGLMVFATQTFNRFRNDVEYLMKQIGANKKINIELLLESGFLVPAKRMKTKGKFASTDKDKDKEKDKEEDKEKEKKKEEKKSDDAVASRRSKIRGEETRTHAHAINPSDYYDKLLNYLVENGFKGDAIQLHNEIYKGKYNDTIIEKAEQGLI